MKITKKKVTYAALEVLFIGIAPLGFVVAQYGNIGSTGEAVGFKIGITGALLCILTFLIFKKVFLDRYLDGMNQQINNLASDLRTENDPGKITNIERALKGLRTAETITKAILPLLLLLAVLMMCRALEAELVKLSGAVGFIIVSYLTGTVFSVLGAREVHSKHRKGEER